MIANHRCLVVLGNEEAAVIEGEEDISRCFGRPPLAHRSIVINIVDVLCSV